MHFLLAHQPAAADAIIRLVLYACVRSALAMESNNIESVPIKSLPNKHIENYLFVWSVVYQRLLSLEYVVKHYMEPNATRTWAQVGEF